MAGGHAIDDVSFECGSGDETAADLPFGQLGLHGAKLLVVASTGGHLWQAVRIADALNASHTSMILTFRTEQSTSLQHSYRTAYAPYVGPRDAVGALSTCVRVRRLLKREPYDAVLSTGAGVAVAAMLVAARSGIRGVYIESYARFEGPSLSGRLVSRLPGTETFTQHETWSSPRWPYTGEIALPNVPRSLPVPAGRRPAVFVTLGTIERYRFDSLVDRLVAVLPPDVDVTWQLGATTRSDLPGEAYTYMSSSEFAAAVARADVVVTHGGVGTVLGLLEVGKSLIVVPRRDKRGEHVDDHQVQLARELSRRALVVYREVADLVLSDLWRPAAQLVDVAAQSIAPDSQ